MNKNKKLNKAIMPPLVYDYYYHLFMPYVITSIILGVLLIIINLMIRNIFILPMMIINFLTSGLIVIAGIIILIIRKNLIKRVITNEEENLKLEFHEQLNETTKQNLTIRHIINENNMIICDGESYPIDEVDYHFSCSYKYGKLLLLFLIKERNTNITLSMYQLDNDFFNFIVQNSLLQEDEWFMMFKNDLHQFLSLLYNKEEV